MVRLEALCEVQQDSLQNQQDDKFKPEVYNAGAFPLVLAKGSIMPKKEILEKKQSSG